MSWKTYRDLEENFNETIKELEELKTGVLNEVEEMKNSINVSKVERFKPLLLNGVKIVKRSRDTYDGEIPIVFIEIPDIYKYTGGDKERREYTEKILEGVFVWSALVKKYDLNTEEKIEKSRGKAKELIEKIVELDKENHEYNIEASCTNEKTHSGIRKLLEEIGISDYTYKFKTKRSKNQSKVFYEWPSEIGGQIPRNYKEGYLQGTKEELFTQIDGMCDKELKKIKEEKAKKEKEEKLKRDNKVKALLLSKYDLSLEDDWEDLESVMIEKCKYLRLASAMEDTRGDWSEGFYRVENALSFFDIETDEDKDIYAEVNDLTYGDEIDGRIFRDCEYNYDYLYTKVNEELLKDFREVKNHLDLW